MSYASLFEDVIERLQEALDGLQSKRERRQSTHPERTKLKEVVLRAQTLLHQLFTALEVATDPDVRLGSEVKHLKTENSRLQAQAHAAEKKARDFQMRLLAANGQNRDLQRTVHDLQSQLRKLDSLHEKLLKRCPKEMYDAYSSPGRIAKYKPTE